MASAESLKVTHDVDAKVRDVEGKVEDVQDDVQDVGNKVQNVDDSVQVIGSDVNDICCQVRESNRSLSLLPLLVVPRAQEVTQGIS